MIEQGSLKCVECRKSINKAQRKHKGHSYCSTCYSREFKHRICKNCGNEARLPKFDLEAVCKECESSGPCIRCKKDVFKTAKLTELGRVCPSCAHYFKSPEPCENCGIESTKLSRGSHLNHDLKVCPKCFYAHHKTCDLCHHHRETTKNDSGKNICKKCLTIGEVACKTCKELMPAGRGKQCESCYWKELLSSRLKVNLLSINQPLFKSAYSDFSKWLSNKRGNNITAIKINRYRPFFSNLDKKFSKLPNYEELLKIYGPEGLRKYRSAIEWLDQSRTIEIDEKLKHKFSELGQIDKRLSVLDKDTPHWQLVSEYLETLNDRYKKGKIKLRTMRLAISATIKFLDRFVENNQEFPSQKNLTNYLIEYPGQKNNITGFINHLNKLTGLALSTRVEQKLIDRHKNKKLENDLLSLINKKSLDEMQIKQWILLNLRYHHRLNDRDSRKIYNANTVTKPFSGQYLLNDNDNLWIPPVPQSEKKN